MKLFVRLSSGVRFSTEFSGSTTQECKEHLHAEHSCAEPQLQKLIYKGRILKDGDVFAESGIVDGSTLFLVTVKGNSSTPPKPQTPVTASTTAASPPATTPVPAASTSQPMNTASESLNPPTTTPPMFGMSSSGAPSPFGSTGGTNDPLARAQEALNNPMLQNMINSNPEFFTNLMRQQMESNPALRQLMESNPMVREALNDPASLRQMLQGMANPEVRNIQQRQHDLALSQIENMPGGFNALRNLYESVQSPLEDSLMDGSANSGTASETQTSSGTAGATGEAMPNPWGSPSSSSNTNTNRSAAPSMPSMFGGLGGAGGANPFGMMPNDLMQAANSGQPPNPQQQESALQFLEQNPQVQQMMEQTMQQNPGMIRNIIQQTNPMMAQMVQGMDDRQLQEMMRMAMNPAAIRNMMQMEQQMRSMGIGNGMLGMPGNNPWATGGGAAAAPNPWAAGGGAGGGLDFSSLLSGGAVPAPSANPRDQYARQLQQMRDMGFDNEERALGALQRSNGNLNRAVDILFAEPAAPAPAAEEAATSEESAPAASTRPQKDADSKKND